MKSLTRLAQLVLMELGQQCGVNTIRDWKTVTERYEHEGLEFFTLTLPAFCKEFERALAIEQVDSDAFSGFSRSRKTPGLPSFLRGFLRRVFDERTGRILDRPNVDAIRAVRQFTLMLGKLRALSSDRRCETALINYVETDREVGFSMAAMASREDLREEFIGMSKLLWADLLSRMDSDVYTGRVRPKHGPGATADRLRGNAKYDQHTWTDRLEEIFPACDFLVPNYRHWKEIGPLVTWRPPEQEQPVKVVLVPKTAKAPRVIAEEPSYMQYMQQALLERWQERVAEDFVANECLRWTDQRRNQIAASSGRQIATLDLSEASDRVSLLHVKWLTSTAPWFQRALWATRSTCADVPGRGVIPLNKYASMGSALCFPVESFVFTTVVFIGIQRALGRPLSRDDVESLAGKLVNVYGDDITCPSTHAPIVVEALEDYGFRVNRNKSFWTGGFRESCGTEWYDGRPVIVARVRNPLPRTRRDAEELVSLVSFRNQLYKLGLRETAQTLDEWIREIIPFPEVGPDSPVLGRVNDCGGQPQRTNPRTHVPEVFGCIVRGEIPRSPISGHGALLKHFLKRSHEAVPDRRHLSRAGRPRSVALKTGWFPAF